MVWLRSIISPPLKPLLFSSVLMHHLKPGGGHTYKDSEAFAAAKGGRLLTLQERRATS